MTPHESGYVNAIKAFFSSTETSTHCESARECESRMSEVYANHLDDPEASLFYSPALLASADPRDKSYADQFKSTGLLNWVQYSKNFLSLSLNPSGEGSTVLFTGIRGEEARFFSFVFGVAPTGGPRSS